eukprot:jgi/Botrbrau1/6519/Bobra.0034s0091.1
MNFKINSAAMPKEEQRLLRSTWGLFNPWALQGFMVTLVQYIQAFLNWIVPAPLRIHDLALGGRVISHVVLSLTELNVADALLKGPQTIQELSTTVGADPDCLGRAMRAAVHFGIFKELRRRGQPSLYRNNHLSASLCESHVMSQKYMILAHLSHSFKTMDSLTYGIQTGKSCYQHYSGRDDTYWDLLKENPEGEIAFSRSMSSIDNLCRMAMLADIDWSKWDKVTDISGAFGGTLAAILPAYPGMRGVLFEQPQVIDRAREIWAEEADKADLLPRVDFVSGNFFEKETLPKAKSNKEVYSLKFILHDWNDDDCLKILHSLRHAIGDTGASLLIIDCMPRPNTAHPLNRPVFISDIAMMAIVGGKERSFSDLEMLLARSGFKLTKIYMTRSIMTAVEASPTDYAPDLTVMSLKAEQ